MNEHTPQDPPQVIFDALARSLEWRSDCCSAPAFGPLRQPSGSECVPDWVWAATREGICAGCHEQATFEQQ